ncbi:MAG: ABC transporter permease subunit [Deltaproteobacteria bacterium]|nr:ABC transporter permease subunit [Deltaproteobacteria bacterium]
MTILAQIKREFLSFFFSPIAYVLLVATMIYNGIVFLLIVEFLSDPRAPHGAAMQFMFGGTDFFYILIITAASFITMRLIAHEKNAGTLEALLTAPINDAQVVAAKFLAAVCFYIVLWLPTLAYPLILSRYSEVDMGPIAAGYLGTLGMGMMFLSVGLLASSLSRNQIVAALLSFGGNMILFLLGIFEFVSQGQSSDSVLSYLNLWNHMPEFSRGIVDTRHLVYYISVTLFMLFTTVQVLQARRWRA